jgi:hypothetical protein
MDFSVIAYERTKSRLADIASLLQTGGFEGLALIKEYA